MLVAQLDSVVCTACGANRSEDESCHNCGSPAFAVVRGDAVIGFSEGTAPCFRCAETRRLKFRGWATAYSFIFFARADYKAGYVCDRCADVEASMALTISSLIGWLSIPSWFWVGWRALYVNWRSVFAPPAKPLDWGALEVDELLGMIEEEGADDEFSWRNEHNLIDLESPLGKLDQSQLELVLSSHGLYELLGVEKNATHNAIRTAYRDAARAAHPDTGNEPNAEAMIAVNRAWEVLGNEELRIAYDWVEQERQFQ